MAILQDTAMPVDLGTLLGNVLGPINLPPADAPGPEPPDRPPPRPPRSKQLSFTVQKQEQDLWCWAAITVSVADFYDGTTSRQCDLVNRRRGRQTCCSEPDASDETRCNIADVTSQALQDVNHLDAVVGVLTFRQVQDEIVENNVIGVRIAWPGTDVGHAITLDGYYITDDGTPTVIGKDPAPGESFSMPYDEFKTAYGDNKDGTWDKTLKTK